MTIDGFGPSGEEEPVQKMTHVAGKRETVLILLAGASISEG